MITNSIFKTVGFVDLDKTFINDCKKKFNLVITSDNLNEFLESTYHSEYIDIMFSNDNFHFEEKLDQDIIISKLNKSVSLNKFDLFIFKNTNESFTGIYSIDYLVNESDLSIFSDISFSLINFQTEVEIQNSHFNLIDFISNRFFNGIKLNSIESSLSQYSGRKFKHYTILDFDKPIKNSDELLFEIGTSSKIDSINNNDINSPSESYLNSILKNKLSCFNNYSGLSLFDSFTVIGVNNYNRNNYYSHSSWDVVYFKIFIYNQFLKSRLQIISNSFSKDPLLSRRLFDDFYSNYNLNKISFNFLPNEIYTTIYNSLEIEVDISFLQSRIESLSQKLNEVQQEQQEYLLLCLSILAAIEIPIHIEGVRKIVGINDITFFNSIIYPSIFIILILIYLYKFKLRKNSD